MISVYTSPVDGAITIEQPNEPRGHLFVKASELPKLIRDLMTHLGPELSGTIGDDLERDTIRFELFVDHSRSSLAANRLPTKYIAETLLRQAVDRFHHGLVEAIENAKGES